ncbi:putative F-box protein At5g62060 [Lolium perenne]|uniref:putative F-box protein At5g62060 n=1 Tax=Lolium perenne TaxID=4522 RepID=UPI0021F52911|nr:uncharacterized protein LOC127303133 [Lolium perenne]
MAAKRQRCAVLDEPMVLPDHLIEQILMRLPQKSLIRCRCLSRAWAATLSSGDFANSYHHVANIHGGPRIFGVQDLLDGHEPKVLAPLTRTLRVITVNSFPRFAMELPQMTALPEGRTTGRRGTSIDYIEKYESLGLGYDVHTKKHKVVRIYYSGQPMSTSSGCEVFEINGPTEMWRPTGEKPMGWIDRGSISVFAQEHVYWLAYHELYPRPKRIFIMSFSFRDEKLGTIQPPPLDTKDMTHELTELGGRLCLFTPYKNRYNIWLLDRYGPGGATWDLRYRIDIPLEVMPWGGSPLAIIDDGRRIVLTENSCPNQIYAYDPLTKKTENLLDWSIPNSYLGINGAAVYEESIASPGRQPCKDTVLISSPSTQALWLVLQLQLLPQRTIGRLMCVCRSWRSMICCHVPTH